jgi:predicted membrane-bound mannosyltransferase
VRENHQIENVPATALADFPGARGLIERWQTTIAETGWTPWLILVLAIFLRFFLLGIKPPHFDEGINGWFVDQMVKNGFYNYDPTNYHGPLHFYVLFLSQALLGRNILALRLPVVLVSIVCVWLCFKFEPFVGRTVSRIAALAMAISPGFVFYGRYSIHEVWLLLFTMLFIFGLLGLWKFGTRNYLWCAGMGITGMILSKETYIIHIVCAAIAAGVLPIFGLLPKLFGKKQRVLILTFSACLLGLWFVPWFKATQGDISGATATSAVPHGNYLWISPVLLGAAILRSLLAPDSRGVGRLAGAGALLAISYVSINLASGADSHALLGGYLTAALGAGLLLAALIPPPSFAMDTPAVTQQWDYVDLAFVAWTGIGLIVFFYSGTFFHWNGVKGLYQAYIPWFTTGSEGHGHEKPWYYWLQIMAPSFERSRADCLGYELPALAGIALCLFSLRFKSVGLRYLSIYGVGTFIVYSYVHYKTPWCIISFIWPFLFTFGALVTLVSVNYERIAKIVCGALMTMSFGSSIWLNYFHCTTDTEPYVYVQTYNDIFKLTDRLLALAHRDPIFYQVIGHIIRTSAYPLPWILDDFPKIGYYEHNNSPPNFDADFLLVQEDRVEEVEGKLHDSYYTEPLKIRPYQDESKLYLSARIFKGFFPSHTPDFVGKPITAPPTPPPNPQ